MFRSLRAWATQDIQEPGLAMRLTIMSCFFLETTWFHPGPPDFPGSVGQLDPAGHAAARLVLPAAVSAALVGERFHFCAVLGGTQEVTDVVRVPVIP